MNIFFISVMMVKIKISSFYCNFLKRAILAKAGIYANDPVEAMYPYTRKDIDGVVLALPANLRTGSSADPARSLAVPALQSSPQ